MVKELTKELIWGLIKSKLDEMLDNQNVINYMFFEIYCIREKLISQESMKSEKKL